MRFESNTRKINYRRVFKYTRLWERVVEVFPHIEYFNGDCFCPVDWEQDKNSDGEGHMTWRLPGVSMKFWQKVMAEYKGHRCTAKPIEIDGEPGIVCTLPCGLREYLKFHRPLWRAGIEAMYK